MSTRLEITSCHTLPALWNELPSLLENKLDRTDFRRQLRRHCLYEYEFFVFFFSLEKNYDILLVC